MKMKMKILIIFVLTLFILFVMSKMLQDSNKVKPIIDLEHDLTTHAAYNAYDFSDDDKVIDIGIQPLWLPTSIISEAMKHDIILRNILSESGMELRFFSFFKGADVNCFIKSRDLEAGIGGDMPTLTAIVESDIYVAGLIQSGFNSIVSKKYLLMSELRGKRIGFPYGSLAHYALLVHLTDAGMKETDVILVPMEVNEMPDALNEDRIAAFSAWEPTPTIALNKYKDQIIMCRNRSRGYLYFTRTFSNKYPEVVKQIIASEIRAIQWIQRDRQNLLKACEWATQAGRELSGNDIELSIEQLAGLALNDLLGLATYPIIPVNDLKQNGPLHIEYKFIKNIMGISDTAEWDEIVDNFDRNIIFEIINFPENYLLNKYNYELGEKYE